MAGLFDWQDPNTAASMTMAAGLLNAGGPQTRPVSLGQALSQGMLGGQAAYRAAEDQQFQRQLMAERQQLMAQQVAAQKQAQELARAKQGFLLNLPAMMNMPMRGGPTVQNAQMQGQITPELAARAVALGIDTKTLAEVAGARNIGRPEVKHWADVRNPDGSVSVTGFDQFGDARNTGAQPYKAPEFRDLGGSVVGIDPITGKPLMNFNKTMTPGERDSSARGWAGLALQRENATRETAKERADARKVAETERKDQMRRDMQVDRAGVVLGAIDQAIGQVGRTTAGLPGAALGMVPGTNAYDLRRTVDTIKANIGFQELQAMREASPTGGALGQVAVQELNMLQAVIASLDANQSQTQLRAGLEKARAHFSNWKQAVEQAGGKPRAGAEGGWDNGWSIQKVD